MCGMISREVLKVRFHVNSMHTSGAGGSPQMRGLANYHVVKMTAGAITDWAILHARMSPRTARMTEVGAMTNGSVL